LDKNQPYKNLPVLKVDNHNTLSQFNSNSFINPPIDNLENLENSRMKLKLNIKKRKEKIVSTTNVLT